MIWLLRIYLFLYFILYFGIGAWAVIEPVREILEFDIPSFMLAVGLSVSAPIGYSEVAGLYGGINLMVGIFCLLGLFSKYLANKALFILAFLTFSIAAGRYLLSLMPTAPGFLNSFFIFEVATFFISIFFMIYLRTLNQPAKKHDVGDVATNES